MTCLPLPSSQTTQTLMGHSIYAEFMVISCRVLTAPRAAQTRTCCTRLTAVSWRSGSTTRRRPSRATTGRCHVMPPCATCARAPSAPDLQWLSAYIHRSSVTRAALCGVCAPSHGLCGCIVSVFCLQLGCWDVRKRCGCIMHSRSESRYRSAQHSRYHPCPSVASKPPGAWALSSARGRPGGAGGARAQASVALNLVLSQRTDDLRAGGAGGARRRGLPLARQPHLLGAQDA